MLISYNKINEKVNLSLDEVCAALISLGHEVETVDNLSIDKLVVGEVIEISKHPNADKLNICKVDINEESPLQIVCGAPNVKDGIKVVVAKVGAKLGELKIKKSKIRDVESFGMLCSIKELGIEDRFLLDSDIDGIHILNTDAVVGTNPLTYLNLEDNVIDVSLTANRGDCLSYNGLIRDLFAYTGNKYEFSVTQTKPTIKNDVKINIEEGANSFSIMKVEIENNFISPIDLRIELIKHNINPQNIVVDCANLAMLNVGIPLHVYDAEKLTNEFTVKTLDEEVEYVALDDETYKLQPNNLVITNNNKVCSLASVIGSDYSKIELSSKSIYLEIGDFDKTLVRKSASVLKKKTDASIRGEKGIDSNALNDAANEFLRLLSKYNVSFKNSEINKVVKNDIKKSTMKLDLNEIEVVLGITIDDNTALDILANLYFELIHREGSVCEFSIPSWRHDIENDHDLIEEIVRIYGLDNIDIYEDIQTIVPSNKVIKDPKASLERKLESFILKHNLNQVVTYSLVSEEDILMVSKDLDNVVELMSPLSQKRKYYRTSLVSSLLDIHNYNFSRNQSTSNIFEIANTYLDINNEIEEKLLISGLVSGVKERYIDKSVNYDFFDLKFICEQIAKFFNVTFDFNVIGECPVILNEYASAEIVCDGNVIGFIGKITPEITKEDIFVFEINLDSFIKERLKVTKFIPLFEQLDIKRDLTFDISKDVEYTQITNIFKKVSNIVNTELTNIYHQNDGETISYTFTISFNSKNEKLDSQLVENSLKKIVNNALESGYGFKGNF